MSHSIGSLGKDSSTGIVTKVVLDTAFIRETTNGVRIKTWQVITVFILMQVFNRCFHTRFEECLMDYMHLKSPADILYMLQGGNGYVRGVRFENVRMENVDNPIIIDQFYCDSPKSCQNQVHIPSSIPLSVLDTSDNSLLITIFLVMVSEF